MPKNRHAINDKLDDVLSGQQSDEVDGLQALLSLPMSPAKSPTRSPPLRATPGGAGLVGSPSPLRHMMFKSPASALKQSPIEDFSPSTMFRSPSKTSPSSNFSPNISSIFGGLSPIGPGLAGNAPSLVGGSPLGALSVGGGTGRTPPGSAARGVDVLPPGLNAQNAKFCQKLDFLAGAEVGLTGIAANESIGSGPPLHGHVPAGAGAAQSGKGGTRGRARPGAKGIVKRGSKDKGDAGAGDITKSGGTHSAAGFLTPNPDARRRSRPARPANFISPAGSAEGSGRAAAHAGLGAPAARARNPCNCKKSRCLKLYCECFAANAYCDACNCKDCHNTAATEAARQEAIDSTLERNPNAFQAKIKGKDDKAGKAEHASGCHCKKSACLKKYCECFQASIFCCGNCKCMNCKNFLGSVELAALANKQKRGRSRTARAPSQTAASASTVTVAAAAAAVGLPRAASMAAQALAAATSDGSGTAPPVLPITLTQASNVTGGSAAAVVKTEPNAAAVTAVTASVAAANASSANVGGADGAESNIDMAMDGVEAAAEALTLAADALSPTRVGKSARGGDGVNGARATKKARFGPASASAEHGDVLPIAFSNHWPPRPPHVSPADEKESSHCFGRSNAPVKKKMAITVLHFLDNDDLYNQSLVSKRWCKYSLDRALWDYPAIPAHLLPQAPAPAAVGHPAHTTPEITSPEKQGQAATVLLA